MRVNNVEIARLERLAKVKDKADLQVGHISLETNDAIEDDATPTMRKVYQQCASIWGSDERWLDPETRHASKYGIYQYGTGIGDLVEVMIWDKPEIGALEIDITHFDDPDFALTDVLDLQTNADQSCVRVGGFRDREYYQKEYNKWRWPALEWTRKLVNNQLTYKKSEELISVEPAFDGYGLHVEGTDINYRIAHIEVLGDALHIGCILNSMRAVQKLAEWERSPIFWDMRLNPQQCLAINATSLTASSVRPRKQGTEGVNLLEKTSMCVKDQL